MAAAGLQFGNVPVGIGPTLIRLRRQVSLLDEVALTATQTATNDCVYKGCEVKLQPSPCQSKHGEHPSWMLLGATSKPE